MAHNNKVTIIGQQKLLEQLKKFGDKAESRLSVVIEETAINIANDAQHRAPIDNGDLRQSINANNVSRFFSTVSANVKYAAYVEFGTGGFVEVAPEWKNLAMDYYVNGQGYMHPKPYLYPAFVAGRSKYRRDLQELLDNLAREFNS